MKKYLFNGAMALSVGAFIVSCSHDDIGQTSTVEQMTKSFDEMFTELYGPIAPNHNWGFETIAAEPGEDEAAEEQVAGTRSTEKEDHTLAAVGLTKPTLKDGEAAFVMDYFQKNEGANSVGLDIDKYFIIFVGGNTTVNVWHHDWDMNYYNNNKKNGAKSNFSDVYSTQSAILDQLWIGGEHIKDWNANGGVTEYVYDRTANKFIAHNSFCDAWTTKWKLAKISYGGEEGWYVGLSAYAKKSEGIHTLFEPGQEGYDESQTDERAYYTDYDRPEFYDDYVFKIVPANPIPPYHRESTSITTYTYKKIIDLGRVFCEDIATATRGIKEDIDYNDIVFDARVWKIYDVVATTINGITTYSGEKNVKYQYDISMLAAGGTIPENVGINNVDVHDAFGVGLTFMVNTWTPNSTAFGQYNTPTNVLHPKNGYETISYTLNYNQLRDKNNVGISSIPINVKYNGQNVMALDDRTGLAPYKLCVPIGTLWPIERVSIDAAYTGFTSFVNSPDNKFYNGSQVSANLYTQAPTSRIQSDGWNIGYTQLVSSSTTSSTVDVVWEGNVSSGGTPIKLYNYTFSEGQTLCFYGSGSGTISVLCGAGSDTGLISNGSMAEGYIKVTINADQAAKLSQGLLINGSNFSLTKIIVL